MKSTNEIYARIEGCYTDVVKYLRRFDLSKEDLQDAIQDTFVEAFSKAHTLRDPEKAKNWVIKIARSKGLKYKRKRNILITIECAFKEDVVQLDCQEAYEEDALAKLILKADMKDLIKSMTNLKPKERSVLIHQYIYDEKLKDIALIIGENLNNTKSISRRAKEKVKNYLIDGGYQYGRK